MPGSAIFNTSPGQPVSATTRLLPPPRTNRGRSRERANVAACCTSPIFLASTKYLAGPPILMVVSGASGMFSSTSTDHFQIYTWVEAGAPGWRVTLYLVHPRLWRSERQANILMRKENSMRNNFRLRAVLLLGSVLALLPVACSSNGNSSSGNSAMNMAGAWTVTAVSTEGKGTVSGTANVEQSGQGLGTNGVTTLTAVVGSISFSQSGTRLTGTITDSIKGVTYNFTGTLSGD